MRKTFCWIERFVIPVLNHRNNKWLTFLLAGILVCCPIGAQAADKILKLELTLSDSPGEIAVTKSFEISVTLKNSDSSTETFHGNGINNHLSYAYKTPEPPGPHWWPNTDYAITSLPIGSFDLAPGESVTFPFLSLKPQASINTGQYSIYQVQLSYLDPESSSLAWATSTNSCDWSVSGGVSHFSLSVDRSGTGAVTSSPSGINCGPTCFASYPSGASITLTATPDTGSYFYGWSPPCSGNGNCSVALNADTHITATFYPVGYNPFADVPTGNWAEPYISAIYAAHITTGVGGANQYRPDDEVTREQMAAFIIRAKAGEPAANYCDSGCYFPDVSVSGWACPYIKRLYELGITTGYGGTNQYRPELPVTREQMAAFIIRAIEGDPADNYCASGSPFTDVDPASWSCKYIKRLYEKGITTGYGGTSEYKPLLTVTRAQMATFIGRAFLNMQTIDWQAYLNYTVGRRWQYSTPDSEGTYSEYIKETTTRNGFNVYVKGWSSNYSDWLDYNFFQSDGVYYVGYYDEDERADFFFSTPCRLFPSVVRLGAPISITCQGTLPASVQVIFELVDGVTVPYGTFNNVMKVTHTTGDGTRIGWYAKGIGQIRDHKASNGKDHPLLHVTDGNTTRPAN